MYKSIVEDARINIPKLLMLYLGVKNIIFMRIHYLKSVCIHKLYIFSFKLKSFFYIDCQDFPLQFISTLYNSLTFEIKKR